MGVLDAMLGSLRGCLEGFPDKRRGLNVTYSMANIAMAAFSVFFMRSPSFLAHQRRFEEGFGRSNCETLFGLSKIPSDNHIRNMLDPASPELLYPVFAEAVEQLAAIEGGLDAFHHLGGLLPIALDGTDIIAPTTFIVRIAPSGSGARTGARRNISTPCRRRPWSRRGTIRACRQRRRGDPAGAGIHRPARWGGEAGLRKQGG